MSLHRTSRRSSARSGRYGKRRDGGLFRKLFLIALLVLMPLSAIGIGGYFSVQHLNKEQMDVAFCYGREDQYQTAVFIDFSFTHQTSGSQRRDLINALNQTFDGLPPNGKISVFTTANATTASVSRPVFTLCNPAKTATEQTRIGAPTTSAAKLVRQHREARAVFAEFVETLMAQSTDQSQVANTSPILEQVRGLSHFDFGSPLSKLVAYTDGINNSPAGRFCAQKDHLPRFETFAARSDYRYIAPDDFGGAEVVLFLIESGVLPSSHLPFCTNPELRAFWSDYFEGNGAGSVTLTPLGYGAGQ